MGKWALAALYDQANNRLRLRFPLRELSVFLLDRGVCTPLQFPSGMSLIDRKDRTMQNIAEFRIIGRVGKIAEHDKVTKVNVAANVSFVDCGTNRGSRAFGINWYSRGWPVARASGSARDGLPVSV